MPHVWCHPAESRPTNQVTWVPSEQESVKVPLPLLVKVHRESFPMMALVPSSHETVTEPSPFCVTVQDEPAGPTDPGFEPHARSRAAHNTAPAGFPRSRCLDSVAGAIIITPAKNSSCHRDKKKLTKRTSTFILQQGHAKNQHGQFAPGAPPLWGVARTHRRPAGPRRARGTAILRGAQGVSCGRVGSSELFGLVRLARAGREGLFLAARPLVSAGAGVSQSLPGNRLGDGANVAEHVRNDADDGVAGVLGLSLTLEAAVNEELE